MEGNGRTRVADHAEEVAGRLDVDVVPTAPEDNDYRRMRRARTIRRTFMALVAAFLLLGLSGTLGVRTRTVTAEGGGYELSVTYGQVSRPGLPTAWGFEVHHPGGFDGPITISASSAYLDLFDENGFDPQPAKVTATPDAVIWEFEPPPGDTLAVSLDARIEPAAQWGRSAVTSVLEEGRPVVSARYKTWVLP
ncbi:MAG: hypothetical protein ACRDYV_05700 [Acidimicrobiia bacterium]